MMFVPLALIAIVGSASAQYAPGTTRYANGLQYTCDRDSSSFVDGAQAFAQCILAATPNSDFNSVFSQLSTPSGLNSQVLSSYCSCWGTLANPLSPTIAPGTADEFVECYNQALGGCVGGNQAAFDQRDNQIWNAVVRFLGLSGESVTGLALFKSVFTTIDPTPGGRPGFRCQYGKSGCLQPTPAPTQPTCPCVTYTQRCTDTPCPAQTATCGVSAARAGSRTTTCSCLKVTGGNTALATPVDCCFCNTNIVGPTGQFTCSTQSTPCPSSPPCVTFTCAAGQWSQCSISCSTGSNTGIQQMTQTCMAFMVMDGVGSSAPATVDQQQTGQPALGGAGCAACTPQSRPCSVPACTTFSCQSSPPSACPTLTCGGVPAQSVTTVTCIQNPGGLVVPPQLCQANGVQCQGTSTPCPVAPPCVTFTCIAGTWTTCPTCSDNGSAGVRTQSVSCQSFVNGVAGQSVPASQCQNCSPQSQPCPNVPPCTTFRCNIGQWTPCPTCCSSSTPPPLYARAAFGATVCPAGYTGITSAATCNAAAQFLNLAVSAPFSSSWPGYIAGCGFDNTQRVAYFNTISSGLVDGQSALICSLTSTTSAVSQFPGWVQNPDGSWLFTGIRRSRHAASTTEQPQASGALALAVVAVAVVVAVVASAVAVFNRVVNKLVLAELRALQA